MAETNVSAKRQGKPKEDKQAELTRIISKTARHLVPFLLLMYVMAFFDRSNISYAQQSYMADTGLTAQGYALGSGMFFVIYAFLGTPANLMLRKVGARKWLTILTIVWGIVGASMAFTNGTSSFIIVRVLLGVAEAGFFPGAIYLTTIFFPKKQQDEIRGLFYMGVPIAMVIGAPLSGLLLQMHGLGGKPGWFWMFLIEGILAIFVGFAAWYCLDDSPRVARYLTHDEGELLADTIEEEANSGEVKTESSMSGAVKSWRVWVLSIVYFMIQVGVYGITFYLPTQVSGLIGKKVGMTVSLISMIPWACALLGTWLLPKISSKYGHHPQFVALILLITGLAIALSPFVPPVLAIVCLCFAATGVVASQPIFWRMPTELFTGAALAGGIGMVNMVGNFGGFFAPNLRVWFDTLFGTLGSGKAGLVALGSFVLVGALLSWIVGLSERKPKKEAASK
ncbi:MFS transporter [Bifidobacterium sp. ESL0728]|uniref:MFS transporter n=1 Tax=Bifidobacterium sp. ESL0728 TaxID=2983220 RepID=UPI0023F77387|nr:MFS transporter [Bifidobacterium sp. ESL0728]WEV59166.1 MFS transporter [Bifidobacterium sp. ESL0728]